MPRHAAIGGGIPSPDSFAADISGVGPDIVQNL